MYALIMAGGQGTRLWPVSKKNSPKQLLKFINDRTLLQTTFGRLTKGFSNDKIFVATTKAYAPQIIRQLPKIPKSHYSIEPMIKDRGPAIALAALLMEHFDKNACFVTAWSDHYIKNEAAYFKALKTADKFLQARPEYFVTIGVRPTYPHTGLGYIKRGKTMAPGVSLADGYKEKPDLKTASKFYGSGRYFWNTGYFVCRADTLLNLYRIHQPKIYGLLMKIRPHLGTAKQQSAINKYYGRMPQVDIEKGLIEKLDKVALVPATFDWADIGSWKIIKDVLSPKNKNLIQGQATTLDAKNNLIYNYGNKLIAAVGVEDLIIVNTKDALLIAAKDKSEQIKELVKKLGQDKKLKKYL